PASTNEDDPVVVAAPPTPIMPLSVIIAERGILPAAELIAAPIVGHGHVSVSVDRHVCGGVAGEIPVTKISIPVHRDVILDASLIVESRAPISNPSIRSNI